LIFRKFSEVKLDNELVQSNGHLGIVYFYPVYIYFFSVEIGKVFRSWKEYFKILCYSSIFCD
jgi:hypothetical protein